MPIFIVGAPQEQFLNVVFDQQGTARYPHDLKYWSAEMEVVLDNGDNAICDDGNVNLSPDGIFGHTRW